MDFAITAIHTVENWDLFWWQLRSVSWKRELCHVMTCCHYVRILCDPARRTEAANTPSSCGTLDLITYVYTVIHWAFIKLRPVGVLTHFSMKAATLTYIVGMFSLFLAHINSHCLSIIVLISYEIFLWLRKNFRYEKKWKDLALVLIYLTHSLF